jgi:hypothetical protein
VTFDPAARAATDARLSVTRGVDMTDENVHSWSVELLIGERDGHTHAEARLHTDDATHLAATGRARLRPNEQDVPEIGAELAAARALAGLAHELLQAAADDIEGVTHQPTTLQS